MMRGIQFRRNNLGVTPVEYVLIGYFFCIFVVVGAKVIGCNRSHPLPLILSVAAGLAFV